MKEPLQPGEYRCAGCGGVFNKNTPDSKANAEAKALFGIENASEHPDMGIVCEDCFQAMKAHFGWTTK